jgi:anti-anti-sigma factor
MIEIESRPHEVAVVPNGNLDWIGATAFRHAVDDLFNMRADFVIDLARTSRVDATGISALVGALRRAQAAGIKACIVNPRPSVQRQLALVRIDQLVRCSHVESGNDAA